jgi:hypothetical protein
LLELQVPILAMASWYAIQFLTLWLFICLIILYRHLLISL